MRKRTLIETIDKLNENCAVLQDDLLASKQLTESQDSEIELLKNRIEEQALKLIESNELLEDVETSRSKLSDLYAQLEANRDELLDKNKFLLEEINKYKNKISELLKEIEDLKIVNKESLEKETLNKQELADKVAELLENNEKIRQKYLELEQNMKQKTVYSSDYETIKTQNQTLLKEKESLEKEYKKLKEQYFKVYSELNANKDMFSNENSKEEEYLRIIEKLTSENKKLRQLLAYQQREKETPKYKKFLEAVAEDYNKIFKNK